MHWNGASQFVLDKTLMETDRTTWSEFPNRGKAILEQILASEERNNPEEQDFESPEFDSKKDSYLTKFEQMPWIFIKC